MHRSFRLPPRRLVLRRRTYATSVDSAASPTGALTVGLRREDPARIWERRCPLTPQAVNDLVRDGVRVMVQPCERRIFPMEEFIAAGAHPHPTLEPAHIILGIKECPLPELLTKPLPLSAAGSTLGAHSVSRTHIMFSHTIKGQSYNMELLGRFLQGEGSQDGSLSARLVDVELLTDEQGKRTVGFGWFAGVAGALESLCAVAHLHLEMGVASPFLYTPRPHSQPSLASLRESLRAVGKQISEQGTPASLGPFVVGLTGSGNVSQGVLSMLSELPIVNVSVADLPALVQNPGTDLHKVYLVHALPKDYLVSTHYPSSTFSREDYYSNPATYTSAFHTRVAPYLTLLINGVGWTPSFPRLMSNNQLSIALEQAQTLFGPGQARMRSVGDISCDVEGGLEFLTHASTTSDPFFMTRPSSLPSHLPSIQMMSVDILPSTLPYDASGHFSSALAPYLAATIESYRSPTQSSNNAYWGAMERATITKSGELVGKHTWLAEEVTKARQANEAVELSKHSGHGELADSEVVGIKRAVGKKRVLVLGSGMVAGPAVDQIASRPDVEVLVASDKLQEARNLTDKHENARALKVDMADRDFVEGLVAQADVVVSLLPVPFHPSVAEMCIKVRTHMVTASYISPVMHALHDKAAAANVLLLNEIGLDPGIDHCAAHALIKQLHTENKRVMSFVSFCGGLPAPDCADVPLGYKFSWSPKGVLSAALNGARFRLGGQLHEHTPLNNLAKHVDDLPVSNILRLEGMANRDSLPYAAVYGMGAVEEMQTLYRGTLRYPGYCDLIDSFRKIGLLDTENALKLQHWTSFIPQLLAERLGAPVSDSASIASALGDLVGTERLPQLLEAIDWLGLVPFSQRLFDLPPLPAEAIAPIDAFVSLLVSKLRYGPGERDLVVLAHEVTARPLNVMDASRDEVHTSTLVTYATKDATAMSRCVGLPVAFAALEVLDGRVRTRGVIGPSDEEVYKPVLDGLVQAGLGMTDTMRRGAGRLEAALLAARR